MDNTKKIANNTLIWETGGIKLSMSVWKGLWPYEFATDDKTWCILDKEEIISLRDALNRLEL